MPIKGREDERDSVIDFYIKWYQNGREGEEAVIGKANLWFSLPCILWFPDKLKMTREVGLTQCILRSANS